LGATFQEYTLTWSGYAFSKEDMATLQVLFISTSSGSNNRNVQIDYIEVVVGYYSTSAIFPLPFAEGFSLTSIPDGWMNFDHIGNGQIWQFGTGGSLSGATGNYAYVNSDDYGNGNSQNTELVSPLINCSDHFNITLSFNHYFRQYQNSAADLFYTTDNGNSWTLIQQWNQNTNNPNSFSVILPDLDNQPEVRFKWKYIGTWDWYWSFDNVVVSGTPDELIPVFTADPTSVLTGETVVFTDQTAGLINSWSWNFGEGAIPPTANTQGPHMVVYSTPGLKNISLTLNEVFTSSQFEMIEVTEFFPPDQYLYGRRLTIPPSNVIGGEDLTDFPVLVSLSDEQLRYSSYGGHVQHPLGYDLIFTMDDCSTPLAYHIDQYDNQDGELIAWVRIPVLSASQNTTIHLYYGRTGVTVNPASANVFSNGYTARYHMNQNPLESDLYDYSLNENHSDSYVDNPVQVDGKIGGAIGFDGNDAIDLGNGILPGVEGTFSAWVRSDQIDAGYHGFLGSGTGSTSLRSPGLWIYQQNTIHGGYGNGSSWCSWINSSGGITNGPAANWHFIVYTYQTGAPQLLFIDGVLNYSYVNGCNGTDPYSTAIQFIGRRDNFYRGALDEISISSVVRSSGWIATEYLNQSDPASFFILSDEMTSSDVCRWVWEGTVNDDWHIIGNWSRSLLPVPTSDVLIPVTINNPVIYDEDVVVHNLTVESDASLSVGPSRVLTIDGDLINEAGPEGVVIRSDVNGTGALIHHTGNVPGSFQRFIPGEPERWHLLSAPVTGQEIAGDFTPSGSYGDGTGYDQYLWYEPDTSWIYHGFTDSWNELNGNNYFNPGQGYLVSYEEENPVLVFKGLLNAGEYSFPVTRSLGATPEFGSNLIGNPFPSSIDWKAEEGWSRLPLQVNDGGYDIWIWNESANNYGTYNSASENDEGTLGVTRFIAPTQAYFVKAENSGILSFDDRTRVGMEPSGFLKTGEISGENIRIIIESLQNFGKDEVKIEFNSPLKNLGTRKKFSFVPFAPSLYIPVNQELYTYRAIPKLEDQAVIPLGFKPGADGDYRISIHFDPLNFEFISLIDLKNGSTQNLLDNNTYTFKSTKKYDTGRFIIQVKQGVFSNPHEPLPVRSYSFGGDVFIDLRLVSEIVSIEIFDELGRIVVVKKLTGGEIESFPLLHKGVFMVRIFSPSGFYVGKILI
jgi:PKD repeat protein